MTHKMRLMPLPFAKIKSGAKTIELRLNDEKRRKIKTDDIIEFTNVADSEVVFARVVRLYKFASFAELYSVLPLDKCGYLPNEVKDARPEDMLEYYSAAEQAENGVVGIEICLDCKEHAK